MASIKKYRDGYRVWITVKGQRDSATFPNKREAQLWAAHKEIELRAIATGRAGEVRTTHDAFSKYAKEVSPTKKGERWEVVRLEKMKREFPNIKLAILTDDHIRKWRDQRLTEVKPASVLREMKLLNSVLEQCRVEWKWIKSNPKKDVKNPSASAHRTRTIKWAEIKQMLRALGYPARTLPRHAVAHAFLLALRTGMRQGELANITWENVKPLYIHTKAKGIGIVTRDVPLSKKARRIVSMMHGYHETSMFNITAASIDTHFRNAKKRAGLSGFTFHDSRHTAATWLGRSGRWNVLEMCRGFGWSDPKMAMVYFNPTGGELAAKLP